MSKQPASRAITILDIQRMREQGKPITMVTAYDYPTAKAVDEAGIPLILETPKEDADGKMSPANDRGNLATLRGFVGQ